MKIKICLLIVIAFCACKQKASVVRSLPDKMDVVMLGKWTMCESHHGEVVNESAIMANVCTAWLFKSDQTGAVGLAAPYYPFHWSITGKTLLISNKKEGDLLQNGSYTLTEKKDKISRLVIISDTVNHIRYFLRRE